MLPTLVPLLSAVPADAEEALQVDADFPGGNIVVDRIAGRDLYVHQDLRDTDGDWFYWSFRVRGLGGRPVAVHFTETNVIGRLGPAVSLDEGQTWAWLGAQAVEGHSFHYQPPAGVDEARFCLAFPYLEADLRRFLAAHAGDRHLQVETLCVTPKGRAVEKLRLGCLDREPQSRVLLTARHHCCEMMASYVLEGLMEAVLSDLESAWLRENVEFLVIPFVDKDGVEDGDQGKNRRPRDHNRDYAGQSIYASVAALREWVPVWSEGKLRVAIDLHCPYIRGSTDEDIYFVGGPESAISENAQRLAAILERVRQGPLPFGDENNVPFGKAWNTGENYTLGKSFARWAAEQPGIEIATTIEVPYAVASGVPVTADSARAFGRDLAAALGAYLSAEL